MTFIQSEIERIEKAFDRKMVWKNGTYRHEPYIVKAFMSQALKHSLLALVEEMKVSGMDKMFGKGKLMDKNANKAHCRNCYINGFTDCKREESTKLAQIEESIRSYKLSK